MKLMSGKMTSKGQITIPKELRELLSVKEGDQLLFLVENDTIKIEPVNGNQHLSLSESNKKESKRSLDQ